MERVNVCNIWKCNCEVPVFYGEQLCPWCKGQGGMFENAAFKRRKFEIKKCLMCSGEGKVDWIQAITQKSPNYYRYYKTGTTKEINMKCSGPNRCKKKLLRLFRDRKYKHIGVKWKAVK